MTKHPSGTARFEENHQLLPSQSRPKTRRLLPLRPTATCSQLSLREQKPLPPIGRETTPPAFFPIIPEVAADAATGHAARAPPTSGRATRNPRLAPYAVHQKVQPAEVDFAVFAPPSSCDAQLNPTLTPTSVRARPEVVAGASKGHGLLAPPSSRGGRLAPLPPEVAWFSSFPEKRPLPLIQAGEVQPLTSQSTLTLPHDPPSGEVRDALLSSCRDSSSAFKGTPPLRSVTNPMSPVDAMRGFSTSATVASLDDDYISSGSSFGQCSLTLSHNLHYEVRGSPLTTGRYPCAASGDTAPGKSPTSEVSSDVATRGSSTSMATPSLEEDDKPNTSAASSRMDSLRGVTSRLAQDDSSSTSPVAASTPEEEEDFLSLPDPSSHAAESRPSPRTRRGVRLQAGPASQGIVPLPRATQLRGRHLSHPQFIHPHPPAEPAPAKRRRRPRVMPAPERLEPSAEVLSRDQLPLPCDEETCPHKESLQHVMGKYEGLKTENIRLKDLTDEETEQMKIKEE
ncbi:hypothetical protein CAPTEDRAFT_212704 [Capitella teleta]|uniref:Uncharacterized protein n=1 Tax=Capitella teleta TaxID=283909 RepID=R7UJ55_CAPTE|nr:hypothetical protein CAPTEDRAFT_212704 [Capitella teleta]|eukprot:ELU06108.1 hypothetical protein CAPTEDRAFT_212704 [Capitella teleta]